MDLRSLLCLILPTLATLHLSLAEDASLVDGSKSSLSTDGQDSNLSAAEKRRWSNFRSWGKRWGNFDTWGKRWASSAFPTWGKKWSGSSFRSWGKRDSVPEEQKQNESPFKKSWQDFSSAWGKRSGENQKKWSDLRSWGKRGWKQGFTAWGKRSEAGDNWEHVMKLFDENDDGDIDVSEFANFVRWFNAPHKDMSALREAISQQ